MKLKQYLLKHGIRLAVVLAILVVMVLSAANLLGGRAGALRNAVGTLKAPVQKAASAMLDWVEEIYGYIYQYDRIVEENNSLRAENAALRETARNYDELEAENERLRALFGWAEKRTDLELESAKIVAWDAGNYVSAFTISKGAAAGIEAGDCVITEYGALVGQIIELGDEWATVRTVIDVNMDVGALVGSEKYPGVITGDFSLMKQGLTKITYLASGAELYPEDEVLTSGKGGTFPADLLIGTIDTVMTEAGGQATYGIVSPACDVSRLSQVFIVKDFSTTE